MANLTDNENLMAGLADVIALRETAVEVARQKIMKDLEPTIIKTVTNLMEGEHGFYDKDEDEESSEDSTNPATDSTEEEAPVEKKHGEGEDAPVGDDTEDQLDSDDLNSDDDGDSPEDGEEDAPIDFESHEGEEEHPEGDHEGGDEDLSMDMPDGEGQHDHESNEYGDEDFDESDDIMIVPDAEGGHDEAPVEHSDEDEHEHGHHAPHHMSHGGMDEEGSDDIFILQDDEEGEGDHHYGADFDASTFHPEEEDEDLTESSLAMENVNLQQQLEEQKQQHEALLTQLADIRLLNQKVEYYEKLKESFAPYETSKNQKIQDAIRKAKQTILDKFDTAKNLNESQKVYNDLKLVCENFTKKLLKESNKTAGTVIAEGAVKGKKNFKLEAVKREGLLTESQKLAQESRKNSLLGDAPTPTSQDTSLLKEADMSNEFVNWKRFWS